MKAYTDDQNQMTRRRFRYDRPTDSMVEIPIDDSFQPTISIHGEIEPFVSPVDGMVIRSKAHLAEYLARKGLRLKEPGSDRRVEDRYAQSHQNQALREELYERVDRMMRKSEVRDFLRKRR